MVSRPTALSCTHTYDSLSLSSVIDPLAKCQFAHGLGELRHVVRHPKYKTTKCKSYWGSGHCPYGSRCRFIHEEVEGYATPQYSPQGSMSSMFSDVGLSGLGPASVSDLGGLSATSSSYLYGSSSNNSSSLSPSGVDHHLGPHPLHHAHLSSSASVPALPSYGKDYSLLASPFDKSAWGTTSTTASRPATKLTYAGDHHSSHPHHAMHHAPHYQHQHHHSFGSAASLQSSIGPIGSLPPLASPTHRHLQSQHAPMPPPPPTAQHHAPLHRRHSSSGSSSNAQSSYPDLQDAIDALMKFSLTQDHDDDDGASDATAHRRVHGATASPAVGTISSVPSTESAAAPVRTGPTVSGTTGAGVAKKKSPADFVLESDELWKDFPASDAPSWSASGLVLNLDTTTPFDVNEKKASGGGSGSEHSPRLSVFERFH